MFTSRANDHGGPIPRRDVPVMAPAAVHEPRRYPSQSWWSEWASPEPAAPQARHGFEFDEELPTTRNREDEFVGEIL